MTARSPGFWTLLTLALSVPAALGFKAIGGPLPWLLGPLFLGALLTLRTPASVIDPVRDASLFLLGLQVGSSLTPEATARLADLPVAALMLAVSTALAMTAGYWIYSRLGGWDRVTSFLAASPGALSTIIALTHGSPADMGRVMLAQSVRLAALIFLFPLAFGLDASEPEPVAAWSAHDYAIALAAALASGLILRWRKVPAAWILGPSAAVAALTAFDMIHGAPHAVIFQTGLLVIGAATGIKLAQGLATGWRASLWKTALGLVAMVAISALVAFAAQPLTGLPIEVLLLAFAPGGFEAMIAMAVALDLDPAFVSAAHVSRVMALTLLLPVIFRLRG